MKQKRRRLRREEVKMNTEKESIELQYLVREARKGSREAFGKLYEGVYQDLYRFALYTLNNPQDAEDVVSEAVIKAYDGIKKLRKEEAFRSWIFAITANLCKKKMREYYKMTEPLKENIEAKSLHMEEKEDLRKAMNTLDTQERLLIYLSVFGGYKSREIASMLRMNPNTIRSKKSRAYEKLSELLV